jgi:hypothetical protein
MESSKMVLVYLEISPKRTLATKRTPLLNTVNVLFAPNFLSRGAISTKLHRAPIDWQAITDDLNGIKLGYISHFK